MFTRFVLARIWNAGNQTHSGLVKDGKTVDLQGKDVRVKQFGELFQDAVQRFQNEGFSVKRVSPWRANAVIRVYRCEAWKHDDSVHWIYGTDTFARNFGVMLSAYTTLIDYAKYEVRWMFWPDDTPSMEPEFVDYFVQLIDKRF